jgi:hypothetical protein
VDTVHERLAAYAEAGVDELIVGFHDPLDTQTLMAFAAEFLSFPRAPSRILVVSRASAASVVHASKT